ncbi:MAG: hypothetical protein IPL25_03790 [Saprospiraceae bacterium]|nr:hypothetical protein [Candidatus Vicinibacter affinis]
MVSKSHKTEDLTFNNLGIFILKLIASDTTNGCRYEEEYEIEVQDPPSADVSIDSIGSNNDSISICRDQKLRFNNNTNPRNGNIYTWEVLDANNVIIYSFETSKADNFEYIFKSQGNYIVRLTARSCLGCQSTDNYYVQVSNLTTIRIFCPSVVCQDSVKEVLYEAIDTCASLCGP